MSSIGDVCAALVNAVAVISCHSHHAKCCRQRDSAQQKDALELEIIALKKSMTAGAGHPPPARRGSQVMLGAMPGSPGQQTSATAAAAEAKADRLSRELEEAEEEISAMTSKIKQQVKLASLT